MKLIVVNSRSGAAKSGFTLIELLVVIAIIAILAAILFPVFAQAREKARQISCLSNEKQIGLGIIMYTQDYDEWFPMGQDIDTTKTPHVHIDWPEEIAPYLKSTGVFECPDDPGAGAIAGGTDFAVSYIANSEIAVNWSVFPSPQAVKFVGVMGNNTNWDSACNLLGSCTVGLSQNLAKITVPDSSIMIGESWNADWTKELGFANSIQTTNYPMPLVIDQNEDSLPNQGLLPVAGVWPNGSNGFTSAHTIGIGAGGGGLENFAYCDGHVHAAAPASTGPVGFPGGWLNCPVPNGPCQADINNQWDVTRNPVNGAQY